jgi:hypothetical protein
MRTKNAVLNFIKLNDSHGANPKGSKYQRELELILALPAEAFTAPFDRFSFHTKESFQAEVVMRHYQYMLAVYHGEITHAQYDIYSNELERLIAKIFNELLASKETRPVVFDLTNVTFQAL